MITDFRNDDYQRPAKTSGMGPSHALPGNALDFNSLTFPFLGFE